MSIILRYLVIIKKVIHNIQYEEKKLFETSMEAAVSARVDVYMRSGDPRRESSLRDPRSEFHTVGKRLKVTTRNTQIVVE